MSGRAIEATITTQGEVWFASREVGRLADTEPYLLNTALYYALGLASGRYVDGTFEPTYVEDTAEIASDVYVSPAVAVGQGSDADEGTNFITSTYNTSDDNYATINYSAQNDPDAGRNLPSYGRRRVLGHGNRLRFFLVPFGREADALDSALPRYVRLGKKRGKARIDTRVLPVKERTGGYQLGHPIGAYDSEQRPVGNLITKRMRPTPLIAQADYEGEHLAIRVDSGANEEQAKGENDEDDPEYVELPGDVQFLSKKR